MRAIEEAATIGPVSDARHVSGSGTGNIGEPLLATADPLWLRIKDFSPDDPQSKLPFSERLAHENGWSRHYASRVIEEYKRFCYLAMTAGHSVTPSDQVDQAWHLHLLYTQSYWDDFCGGVLQSKLHHGPTRGGPEEGAKYHDWYEATLASYRRLFGITPASDIWPPAKARFARAQVFQRIDRSAYWLVPKPRFPFLRRR